MGLHQKKKFALQGELPGEPVARTRCFHGRDCMAWPKKKNQKKTVPVLPHPYSLKTTIKRLKTQATDWTCII